MTHNTLPLRLYWSRWLKVSRIRQRGTRNLWPVVGYSIYVAGFHWSFTFRRAK